MSSDVVSIPAMSDRSPKPEPHPGAAALAITMMALAVAAVLQMIGSIAKIDWLVLRWTRGFGLEGELQNLRGLLTWSWAVLVTFGVCFAMLHAPRNWRRLVLMGSSLLVTLAWIPVLALAGFSAPVGAPLIALFWGGTGAMIYAARHREPES